MMKKTTFHDFFVNHHKEDFLPENSVVFLGFHLYGIWIQNKTVFFLFGEYVFARIHLRICEKRVFFWVHILLKSDFVIRN